MRLVLFDIDGTLLHGHGVGSRAMERAGRALFGDSFSLSGIDFAGALDPWIFAEAARRLGIVEVDGQHQRFHDAYLIELARTIAEADPRPEALPGVPDALSMLSERDDVILGLVTGNYTRAVPLKLRAAGIDPERFSINAFGDEAPTRPGLVRLALSRWQAAGADPDPSRVLVIGDTPRDVDCARQNGCRCLAVATGRHSVEILAEAGADAVVPDLADLGPLSTLLST